MKLKVLVGVARKSLLSMLIVAGGRVKSRSARIDASESGAVAGGCGRGRATATLHATMHCVYRWKCRKVGTFLDSAANSSALTDLVFATIHSVAEKSERRLHVQAFNRLTYTYEYYI